MNERKNKRMNKAGKRHHSAGSWFRGVWFVVLVRVFLCSLALLPSLASADTTPHTLTVTLRDVSGAGIAGATIMVRDEAGTTDLAQSTTDAQGRATLPNLTADVVRVAVSGTLVDGTPLSQRGQDARGIWLLLDAPLVPLDLRSEVNGDILPDPTTMISGDVPIPATPEVATVVHTPATTLAPTEAIGVPTAIPFAALPAAAPADAPAIRPAQIGQGMVIVGALILLLLLGWLIIQRRASR